MGKHLDKELIAEIRRLRIDEGMSVAAVAEKLADRGVNAGHVKRHANTAKHVSQQPKAKPAKKKAAPRTEEPNSDDAATNLHAALDMLIAECQAYVQTMFKRARMEIIRHVAETRKKRIAAGEKLPPIDLDIDD